MTINTIKFSQMSPGGNLDINDLVPGLESGANVLFNVGGSFQWLPLLTTSIIASVNVGYYITNSSQSTVILPDVASVGSVVAIVGNGAGGWILRPGLAQTIKIVTPSSSMSASTSITSAQQYDCIEILCTVANTTWVARSFTTTGFTIV